MIRGHAWRAVLHNDHRPTDAAAVTSDVDRAVMMVHVDADELAKAARAPKFAEVVHESGGVTREPDDRAVHMDNECARAVHFGSSGESDV